MIDKLGFCLQAYLDSVAANIYPEHHVGIWNKFSEDIKNNKCYSIDNLCILNQDKNEVYWGLSKIAYNGAIKAKRDLIFAFEGCREGLSEVRIAQFNELVAIECNAANHPIIALCLNNMLEDTSPWIRAKQEGEETSIEQKEVKYAVPFPKDGNITGAIGRQEKRGRGRPSTAPSMGALVDAVGKDPSKGNWSAQKWARYFGCTNSAIKRAKWWPKWRKARSEDKGRFKDHVDPEDIDLDS